MRTALVVVFTACCIPAHLSGCGSNDKVELAGAGRGFGGSAGRGGSAGAILVGGTSQGGSGIIIDGASGSGTGGFSGDACAYESNAGEPPPLDMYVMFDQSLSMACEAGGGQSRWTATSTALKNFVNSPQAAGIGVGIQYFGMVQALDPNNCTSNYAQPDVPIAVLPGNAQRINNSLNSHNPISDTPTQPALQGAIEYARQWKQQHQDHTVVVVLVTDGQPNTCNSTVQAVAQAAANGAGNVPQIPTFVIGVLNGGITCTTGIDTNPPNQADLDTVARAGGTKQALIVDPGQGDPAKQFLDRMIEVRGKATPPCEVAIPLPPGGGQIDFNRVNVAVSQGGGQPQQIYYVGDAGHCDPNNGGWYYDTPPPPAGHPTRIILCPATCAAVKVIVGGQVDVQTGCVTVTGPPR